MELTISNDKDRLTIILDKKLKDDIKKLADNENRSMGNYIVNLLENHIKLLNEKEPN